jgi:hypothetical protein
MRGAVFTTSNLRQKIQTMSMIRHTIEQDNTTYIELGAGDRVPILISGTPAEMGEGWSPLFAYDGLPSVRLLELQHANGARATWILGLDGERIAGSVAELQGQTHDVLLAEAKRLLGQAVTAAIAKLDPAADRSIDYFKLSGPFRAELETLCGVAKPSTPTLVGLDECGDIPLGDGGFTLSAAGIRASLEVDLQAMYLDACRIGRMRWVSPVDGAAVDEVHGLVISPLVMAWRCVDRRHGIVFWIIVGGYDQETAALYLPSEGILVARPRTRFAQMEIEPEALVTWLSGHVIAHGPELLNFLAQTPRRLAQYTWPPGSAHIGHYLWNELPGLERIVNALSPEQYPLIYDLGGAGGAAFYGPLAHLYPEFRGSIVQHHRTLTEMSRATYSQGVQPLRFSGMRVSAEIRRRVTNLMAGVPALETARQALWDGRGPVVVFGLRVENSTLIDVAGFYISLGKAIARRFGALTIIVDGDNRGRASETVIEAEKEIFRAIAEGLRNDPVTLVNCVGLTVLDNLAWLSLAHYVVAPWGSAMAKYRWACNLPGHALISTFCLRHKQDIHVYDDPAFIEAPTTLSLSPPEFITDRPDAPVMVQMEPLQAPYYINYDADSEQIATAVGDDLAALSGADGKWPRRRPHADFDVRADVIIGRDDELFLCSGGHHVLDHVLGYRTALDRSVRTFAANIVSRAGTAQLLGAKYLHVICPDKQSVMPEPFGVSAPTCLGDYYALRCTDAWRHVIYPKAELRSAGERVFLRTDTHMNHRGTLAVVDLILERLFGHAFKRWAELKAATITTSRTYVGDLGRKLDVQPEEQQFLTPLDARVKFFRNEMNTGNNGAAQISFFREAPIPQRLVLLGDSFGRDLTWMLAELFRETVFLRTPYMHPELAAVIRPNVIITQNVERYLGNVQPDAERPDFSMMNSMTHGESDGQREFAEAMSAICNFGRAPYRRLMDRLEFGAG